ncbi:reverse transcriptase [Caerostris extrusa]|uniref:Reverse transcriptase n=1 Tax=Caerostris extrusa TaxID=172846 RepID=A0AAV4X9U4_CAEEX|nr:reverse transcriptase [Caerostris extrusa]
MRKSLQNIPPLETDANSIAVSPAEKAEAIADCWKLQFEQNPNMSHPFTNNLINIYYQKLLQSAKFDLRGWKHTKFKETVLNQEENEDEVEVPLLGLSWNTVDDTLSCDFRKFKLEDEPIPKRKILSLAHKIFDPIGFTCPVTLVPKIMLQECWKIKVSWDTKLAENIVKMFKKWKTELSN